MKKEQRLVCYDENLQIEAYQFTGIMQKFPNHFHEYYVIGFIKRGHRHLSCKNKDYEINEGDLLLINPHDNHTCYQIDDKALDWRCLNISKVVMNGFVEEIYNQSILPIFERTVVKKSVYTTILEDLHQAIMNDLEKLRKEELLYLLLEQLITIVIWGTAFLSTKISALGYHIIATARRVFFYGLLFMIPALLFLNFHFESALLLETNNIPHLY